MKEKLKRSWRIFKRSLIVLRENKRLLLFPLVISLLVMMITAFFLLPVGVVVFKDSGYSWKQAEHWQVVQKRLFCKEMVTRAESKERLGGGMEKVASSTQIEVDFGMFRKWVYAYFAVLYLVSMFLATFFNVAFYNEILKALNGNPVSITAGIKFAMTRWKAILLWSLLAGVVGWIIQLIEERLDFVGRWIMGLVGVAWSVASVFVAPVIIREREENNPVRCLKKSSSIIMRTWGEGLVSYLGMTGLSGLFTTCLLLATFIALLIGTALLWWLGVAANWQFFWVPIVAIWLAGLAVWLLLCCLFGYVCAVLEKIYIGALYLYGTEGVIPEAFDKETLDAAWQVKRAK